MVPHRVVIMLANMCLTSQRNIQIPKANMLREKSIHNQVREIKFKGTCWQGENSSISHHLEGRQTSVLSMIVQVNCMEDNVYESI